MANDYIVDVHNLCKAFNGKPAVINVSLQIKRGEIFGFLGPNGSGKTTTIRMLCGLMTPDSGSGTCLDFDITKPNSQLKHLVGYVPQYFSLYQDLSVKENLEFVARIYGFHDYKERALRMMTELGLDKYATILAGRLSGGWKQRVSLAAALIHDPQLLLLDEPTAGVDPKARRDFWDYIAHLTAKGISSLVSTHYMDEAERCNRLAYVVYGKLLTEGTIPEIIAHSGLTTFVTSGKDLIQAAAHIRQEKEVEQVVVWGNDLRVCGRDKQTLEVALKRYPHYEWRLTPTSLEEVFIHYVDINPQGALK